MPIDFATLIYPAQQMAFGVAAVLTTVADPSVEVDLTVIDKTEGVELTDFGGGGTVQSIVPAAFVRVADLIDLELGEDCAEVRAAMRHASLTFNGKTWRVEGTQPRPTKLGENDGELLLFLIEIE